MDTHRQRKIKEVTVPQLQQEANMLKKSKQDEAGDYKEVEGKNI